MKKQIQLCIFIFLYNALFHHGMSDRTMITSYVKQQMSKTVLSPYYTAYTILNNEIVHKLLNIDSDSDETAVRILINSLICSSTNILNKLQSASKAIEEIVNTTDKHITQLLLDISNQEKHVYQSEQDVHQAQINLQHAQNQAIILQKSLHETQQSWNSANREVYYAYEEVAKARRCYIKQHKGLWGFIVRLFTGAAKPLCRIVNSAGITRAKKKRSITEEHLIHAYQRVQMYQENFASAQAHLIKTQMQMNIANTQLETTKTMLKEQRDQQQLTASLSKRLRTVEKHLANALGSSAVLQDEIANLIDYELVIEPLNTISNDMRQLNAIEWLGLNISTETSHQINVNLNKLIEILPKMPLNMLFSNETNNNCSLVSNIPVEIMSDIEQKRKRSTGDIPINETHQCSYPLGVFILSTERWVVRNIFYVRRETDQTIFITDQLNDSIVAWTKTATKGQIVAGGNGRGNALYQFNVPTAVLVDKTTNSFIICDAGNKRIIRWPRKHGTTSGTIMIKNIDCFGLAQDQQGYLYVSDIEKHEIRRYANGKYAIGKVVAGGNGQGNDLNQFNFPGHIFVDGEQSIYVSDWNNARTMKWIKGAYQGMILRNRTVSQVNDQWDQHGTIIFNINRTYSPTDGFYMNKDQTLFVSESRNHRVMEWKIGAMTGRVVAGGNGEGNGLHQLSYPRDIVVDEDSIFICDWLNSRVMLWSTRNNKQGELFIDKISCKKLALDYQGSLYVSDIWGQDVKRYCIGENVTVVVGGNGAGNGLNQINNVLSIFVDQDYSIYVLDAEITGFVLSDGLKYWRVMKWTRGAKEGTIVAEDYRPYKSSLFFIYSSGLFVDSSGTVYIVHPISGQVMRWSKGATQGTFIATDRGIRRDSSLSTTAYCRRPQYITLDRYSNLYIASEDCFYIPIVKQFELIKEFSKPQENIISPKFHISCSAAHPNISETSKWMQKGTEINDRYFNYIQKTTCTSGARYGLCIDEEGTTILVTASYYSVEQWSLDIADSYISKVVAGCEGTLSENNCLWYPTHVIVDQDTLLICDRSNNRVMRWPYENGTTGEIVLTNIMCSGLALDDQRNLYVTDELKHEVRRYGLGETNGILIAGGHGKGEDFNQLNSPGHIFVDQDYSLYVSDTNNHRVMKWTQNAKEGIIVAGGNGIGNSTTQLQFPKGLFVDSFGSVYTADSQNNRIIRWSKGATEGTIIIDENVQVECAIKFSRPESLVFDRYGNMYITEPYNYRVQRFRILRR